MDMMQKDVNAKLKAFMEQNAALQDEGTAAVQELEKQANKVVDDTQPALEAARRDDEREAAVAIKKLKEARHIPEEIIKQADGEIEAKNGKVAEAEARLAREAELKIAAARAAAKA